jgi:hypothetical protein
MKSIYLAAICIGFISINLRAQVPVREEPRHKPVLQNNYIRLLDVWLPPGDTTLYHIHEIPSFFIILSNTTTMVQLLGKAPEESIFQAGFTWFNGFEKGPLIHRLWNKDTNALHVIDLELLSSGNNTLIPVKEQAGLKLNFENEKIRVYNCELQGKQNISFTAVSTPMLFVAIDETDFKITSYNKKGNSFRVEKGAYQWLAAKQKWHILNAGNHTARAVLVIFK